MIKIKEKKQDSMYLRVILNSICNAKCYFCHGEGTVIKEEIDRNLLIKAVEDSSKIGFKKVKFTGGEPLLKKDLVEITKDIKNIDQNIEVSMTTNGFLLNKKIDNLIDAGLDRFNVSLHSLNKQNFKKIYGVDKLEDVLSGIDHSIKRGIMPKINMTVSTYNLHEIQAIGEYASNKGLDFRIHNLLPSNQESIETMVSLKELRKYLSNNAKSTENKIKEGKSVKTYVFDSFEVDIKGCNLGDKCKDCEEIKRCGEGIYAVRLDPKGILHPCLFRTDLEVDYKQSILDGNSLIAIKTAYERAAA